VPVPRRFDRSLPERDSTRINERIRVPEVRLIGPDGQQVGILKTAEALRYAQERDLDLVEVAADAKPPVCRVLDYSKYKYEQAQRQKAARKHQQQITIREIKFRPKIAQHDYDTKKGHVERFLKARDKVKVTIMFRGREVAHPERGEIILNRLAEELQDLAVVEQRPTQDGRNMTMMLGPLKAKDSDTQEHATTGARKGDRRRERSRDRGGAGRGEAAPDGAQAPAEDAVPAPAAGGDAAPAETAETAPAAEQAQPAETAPAAEQAQPAEEAPPTEEAEPAEKAPPAEKAQPAAKAKAAAKAETAETDDEPAPDGDGSSDDAPAKPPARSAGRKATAKAK